MREPVRYKILIVENSNPENFVDLENMLKDANCEPVRAPSCVEALRLTMEHDFALALIDVRMPETDGLETVKVLRKSEKNNFLPVIFLTNTYSHHFYSTGIKAGATDIITKPINPGMVLGKIKIFLELHEKKKKLEQEINQRLLTESALIQTEKKLDMALKRAEESDKLKASFLCNISHEIKTPLTNIVGFSELLNNPDVDNETKKRYINIILASSNSLINFFNNILDVSRIESDHFEINPSNTDINSILVELRELYLEILRKNGKSEISLNLHLPRTKIFNFVTDENRFRQVFSHLLDNATKFTVNGSIDFGYEITEGAVSFFVRDSGIGIPQDKFDKIFKPFLKIEHNEIRNSSGTGLGLPIVKKIVEIMGGSISINSQVGKGSEFVFMLPWSNNTASN